MTETSEVTSKDYAELSQLYHRANMKIAELKTDMADWTLAKNILQAQAIREMFESTMLKECAWIMGDRTKHICLKYADKLEKSDG